MSDRADFRSRIIVAIITGALDNDKGMNSLRYNNPNVYASNSSKMHTAKTDRTARRNR